MWDVDCSALIKPDLNGLEVHGAYFDEPKCYALMQQLLKGIDRNVLTGGGVTPQALPKVQQGSRPSPSQ